MNIIIALIFAFVQSDFIFTDISASKIDISQDTAAVRRSKALYGVDLAWIQECNEERYAALNNTETPTKNVFSCIVNASNLYSAFERHRGLADSHRVAISISSSRFGDKLLSSYSQGIGLYEIYGADCFCVGDDMIPRSRYSNVASGMPLMKFDYPGLSECIKNIENRFYFSQEYVGFDFIKDNITLSISVGELYPIDLPWVNKKYVFLKDSCVAAKFYYDEPHERIEYRYMISQVANKGETNYIRRNRYATTTQTNNEIFLAVFRIQRNKVNWETGGEENNIKYVICRFNPVYDGQNYIAVGCDFDISKILSLSGIVDDVQSPPQFDDFKGILRRTAPIGAVGNSKHDLLEILLERVFVIHILRDRTVGYK